MGHVALPNSLAYTTLPGCDGGMTSKGRYGRKRADLQGCTWEGGGGHAIGTVPAASLSWNAPVFRLGRQSKTTWGRGFLNAIRVPSAH